MGQFGIWPNPSGGLTEEQEAALAQAFIRNIHTSDNITEGTSRLFKTSEETIKLGNLPENTNETIAGKVSKVTGKELSANDYSDTDKSNLGTNTSHRNLTNNPHSVNKTDVGLSNVDNTSDADKPVSTAQATADNLRVLKINSIVSKTANFTFALTDAFKYVQVNSSSNLTATIPLNSSIAFPVGSIVYISKLGTGDVTLVATGGVTIRSKDDNLKIDGQYAEVAIRKIANDEWILIGALAQ